MASGTLYTHLEVLIISIKNSHALICFNVLMPILYLNSIDLLSICMKKCHACTRTNKSVWFELCILDLIIYLLTVTLQRI